MEPHFRLSRPLSFFLRGGMGFAYQDTPYDEETNPLNLSYSLYFNTFVQLGLGLEYRFSQQWSTQLAVLYNHTSNGGIQEPNKGLNFPTFGLTTTYSLKPRIEPSRAELISDPPPFKRMWDLQSYFSAKAVGPNRVTYLITGLEFSYLHQFSRVSSWDAGLEWTYHGANRQLMANDTIDGSPHQLNLLAGHAFVMGKFTFSQQAGIYLYRDYENTPDWFQRYGVQYYITDHFSVGSNIRVHGHVAEFLDFRIGYVF
jgi:hypothetical protein